MERLSRLELLSETGFEIFAAAAELLTATGASSRKNCCSRAALQFRVLRNGSVSVRFEIVSSAEHSFIRCRSNAPSMLLLM